MQGDALELAQLLTDEYAAKILIATFRKPMSALELAERFGIPVAQCYRRIHALERAGLLKVESRVLTREGKRIYLYKSLVRNVQIYYEGTKVKVKVALREAAHSEIEKATELISLEGPTHLQGEQEKRFSMFQMLPQIERKESENKKGEKDGVEGKDTQGDI